MNYKWDAIENFDMPILISQSKEDLTWIYPKNNWKKKQLMIDKKSDFDVLKDLFLVDKKKLNNHIFILLFCLSAIFCLKLHSNYIINGKKR